MNSSAAAARALKKRGSQILKRSNSSSSDHGPLRPLSTSTSTSASASAVGTGMGTGDEGEGDGDGDGDEEGEESSSRREVESTRAPTTLAMSAEESLRKFELFEALRHFEPGSSDTDALLRAIDTASSSSSLPSSSTSTSTSTSSSGNNRRDKNAPTPLHTAVRCAKTGTVDLVVRHRPQDLNARDLEGQTALHLATSLGRTEVVKLLLSQPNIDDTIKDEHGRTALEVAKGHETARIIQVSRAQFNETYTSLLAAYVASGSTGTGTGTGTSTPVPGATQSKHHLTSLMANGDADALPHSGNAKDLQDARAALYKLISKDRAKCIDFSALTSGSRGTTIIHEAARRRDIELIKLCMSRGASLVVRDRRGKMPVEVTKDEAIRALCKQSASSEGRALRNSTSLHAIANIPAPAGGAPIPHASPIMKGYLSKWTNMARGYRTRWFVLQHGHLTYYRDQQEEGQASRGTISMSIATVEMSSDKATFTVGTKLGKSPRWYLKGNHPVEAMQWVSALKTAIEAGRNDSTASAMSGMSSLTAPSPSPSTAPLPMMTMTDGSSPVARSTSSNNSTSSLVKASTSIVGATSASSSMMAATGSASNRNATPNDKPAFPALDRRLTSATMASALTDYGDPYTRTPSPQGTDGSIVGDDDLSESSRNRIPHEDNFHLLSNSAKAQVELTEQLLASLAAESDPGRQKEVVQASNKSLHKLSEMLDQHIQQVQDREQWLKRRYEREVEAKRMWEENMRSLVSSQAELEQQLEETQRQASKRKRALRELHRSITAADPSGEMAGLAISSSANDLTKVPTPTTARPRLSTSDSNRTVSPKAGESVTNLPCSAILSTIDMQTVNEAMSDSSDSDDDFYDAVEAGIVTVKVDEPIATADQERPWPADFEKDPDKMLQMKSFEGYKELRDRLPITSDDRPPVSLWAILKGSIGKDLTKISFPVYFNEPTSMLQRMAEDMEYSECLDAASAERNSLKRIAYVTGFAMSNYASTIGRIAKPFNPMLSETFELANLQKKYRYISEQVSHHPPISACIAEAPTWQYYGEVDAKSKFLGKSFEIRPTGIAHAELLLPQDWVDTSLGYPASVVRPGYVREHYSWKKVTTSVSNFIMGNPQIDHYGDMEVTNHRTGERCVLTFKPRGWRGKDACEVKGTVYDKEGNVRWELAGRWNGQLVARKAGAGNGALQPDETLPTVNDGVSSPTIAPEYILIWKINKQPPNMPFNLTKFALTLNDDRPEIKKYLPPTDCRLRPDQHAFERGEFEKANELKSALETFQRATRAKRERGELPPHRPRWFKQQLDKDSEQAYWEPLRSEDGMLEYWQERTRNWMAIQEGKEPQWQEVDEIFGIHDCPDSWVSPHS